MIIWSSSSAGMGVPPEETCAWNGGEWGREGRSPTYINVAKMKFVESIRHYDRMTQRCSKMLCTWCAEVCLGQPLLAVGCPCLHWRDARPGPASQPLRPLSGSS